MIRNLLHTMMMLAVAFLLGAATSNISKANNDCGFEISTADNTWSFTAEPGKESVRYLTVANTTDGDITIVTRQTGSEAFSITMQHDVLHKGDTAIITITYHAGANSVAGTVSQGSLFISRMGLDCSKNLTLQGKVINTTGGGGGDKIDSLVADPGSVAFGQIALGSEACKDVYVVNKSKQVIVITSWSICDGGAFHATAGFDGADTIEAGKNAKFTICFTPDSIHKEYGCNLTVNYTTSGGDRHLVVKLSGALKPKEGNNGGGTTTTTCLRTEQGDGFHDPILFGTSSDRNLILINNTGAAITVTTDSLGCEDQRAFALTGQLPMTIAAHSTAKFSYTFTPFARSNGEVQKTFVACVYFRAEGDSMKCDGQYVVGKLIGYTNQDVDKHTDDTVARPLFPDEKRTLALESHGEIATKTFTFTNNLTVDATVKSITLQSGQYFTITSTNPTPTPFVFHPSDVLTVTLSYTANDKALHTDKLIIDADHALAANEFDLQGINGAGSKRSQCRPSRCRDRHLAKPNDDQCHCKLDRRSFGKR